MGVKLENFFYEEPLNKKEVKFDYEKANRLSDEDFIDHHNQLMNTYQYLWERTGKVNCNRCQENLSGPEDLVRYGGANIHRGVCIKQTVESEKFWSDSSRKKYFQRVAELTSNLTLEEK